MLVGCEKGVLSALDQVRITFFYVNHQLVRTIQILSLNPPSSMLLLMSGTAQREVYMYECMNQCVQESYQNSSFCLMLAFSGLN